MDNTLYITYLILKKNNSLDFPKTFTRNSNFLLKTFYIFPIIKLTSVAFRMELVEIFKQSLIRLMSTILNIVFLTQRSIKPPRKPVIRRYPDILRFPLLTWQFKSVLIRSVNQKQIAVNVLGLHCSRSTIDCCLMPFQAICKFVASFPYAALTDWILPREYP